MKILRVLLTGSGSGGHIFPLLAVVEELKKQSAEFGVALDLRYFGSALEYAQEIVDRDIEFVPILSSKWRRYWSWLNFVDAIKFCLSLPQLLWKIFWFMPNVIFSKGGPGSLAVVLVGKFYLIPVVIHESDTVPGLTNIISGKLAKKIFLGFASAGAHFPTKKIEIVGNPVRESLLSSGIDAEQAKKNLGLNAGEPVLLILGGSQGAEQLNNFVLENLENLAVNFQILHQVGKSQYPAYIKELEFTTKHWDMAKKGRYFAQPFLSNNLGDALSAADVVLSRGGGGTIFELAAFSKPAILIPLNSSANGHQQENSRVYAESGAAIIINPENLLGHLIIQEILALMKDPPRLQKMAAAARSFYRADSAILIARNLMTYV